MIKNIPQILVEAQQFQKFRQYDISRRLYHEFFVLNCTHPLRFKALFEVAENYFYENKNELAQAAYANFIKYCESQNELCDEEKDWIKAYSDLLCSRMKTINKRNE